MIEYGRDWPDPFAPAAASRSSWRPVDLSPVLTGEWQPPEPSVGERSDGVGLFYGGKVHTIASESEGGKTWLLLAVVKFEIERGRHVVYLDFEDSEGGIAGRLLALQVDPATIAERFHYLRPSEAIGEGQHVRELADLIAETRPALVVIDGVTEAMVMHGLDPNSNRDAAAFGRILPRRLADLGPAVVCLDHVAKSTENRGRYALGAVHKLNALDGAAFVLDNRTPFGVGITGRSTVRIAKDRPGQLRKHAKPGGRDTLPWFGDLVVTSHHDTWTEATVDAPPADASGDRKPTVLMGRIMAAIEEHGPLSQRRVRAALGGKAQTVTRALDVLILDGHLTESSPHTILKPWGGEES